MIFSRIKKYEGTNDNKPCHTKDRFAKNFLLHYNFQRGHFVQYTEILQYSSVFGNLGFSTFSILVFPVF